MAFRVALRLRCAARALVCFACLLPGLLPGLLACLLACLRAHALTLCIGHLPQSLLASYYILDAVHQREPKLHRTLPRHMAAYFWQQHQYCTVFMMLVICFNMGLVFWEKPATGDAPSYIVPVMELCCLLIQTIEIGVMFYHSGRGWFWRHLDDSSSLLALSREPQTLLVRVKLLFRRITFDLITAVAVIVMLVDVLLSFFLGSYFRLARALRPLPMLRIKSLRRTLSTLVKTLPSLANVVFVLVVFLFFWALVLRSMLAPIEREDLAAGKALPESRFSTFGAAFLSLFVMASSENYPELMYPAYARTPFYALFFIPILIIVFFILASIIVAMQYETFKQERKRRSYFERAVERRALIAAFHCLDADASGDVSFDEWRTMLSHLGMHNSTEREMQLLFTIVDTDGSNSVDLGEFFELVDALLLDIRVNKVRANDRWLAVNVPWLAGLAGGVHHACRKLVARRAYTLVLLAVFFVNAVVAAVSPDLRTGSTAQLVLNYIDYSLLGVAVVDTIVRAVAAGASYGTLWVHWFDSIVTVLSLVFAAVPWTRLAGMRRFNLQPFQWLRLLRVVTLAKRLRSFLEMFAQALWPLLIVGVCLAIVMYAYAIVGMQLFRNRLANDVFSQENPYANFATPRATFLALFQLTTSSNYYNLMYATMRVTSDWAALYFVSFYVLCSMLLVNLLVSLVLEVFVIASSSRANRESDETEPDDDSTEPASDATAAGKAGRAASDDSAAADKRERVEEIVISRKQRYSRMVLDTPAPPPQGHMAASELGFGAALHHEHGAHESSHMLHHSASASALGVFTDAQSHNNNHHFHHAGAAEHHHHPHPHSPHAPAAGEHGAVGAAGGNASAPVGADAKPIGIRSVVRIRGMHPAGKTVSPVGSLRGRTETHGHPVQLNPFDVSSAAILHMQHQHQNHNHARTDSLSFVKPPLPPSAGTPSTAGPALASALSSDGAGQSTDDDSAVSSSSSCRAADHAGMSSPQRHAVVAAASASSSSSSRSTGTGSATA